jgi:hypothetical protein
VLNTETLRVVRSDKKSPAINCPSVIALCVVDISWPGPDRPCAFFSVVLQRLAYPLSENRGLHPRLRALDLWDVFFGIDQA